MTFRDFVELVRDGIETLAFGLEGDRDLTPMLHLESRDSSMNLYGIDPGFFDSPAQTRLLIDRYVIPQIQEAGARKVAWTYCAWAAPALQEVEIDQGDGTTDTVRFYVPPSEHTDRREVLAAVFIDAERIEHWVARIVRIDGRVMLGPWEVTENASGGYAIDKIQEMLR